MNLFEIACEIPDNEPVLLRIGLAVCKGTEAKNHYKVYMPYERQIVDTIEDLEFINRFQSYVDKVMAKFEKLEKQRRAKRRAK